MVEGRDTACVLVHGASLGRSAGGVTVLLEPRDRGMSRGIGRETGLARWAGGSDRSRRLAGLSACGRVVRAQPRRATPDGFTWDGA
jgi:hypothetical protein